jgi:ferric-dicitrate binding protein FerR (iron transport regulator)
MGNQEQIESSGNSLQERVLRVSATFVVPSGISRMDAWPTFEKKITGIMPGRKEIKVDFSLYLKIAASLCLFALAALTVYNLQDVHVLTGRGEHQLITLPDQSTVLLNARSTLQYNSLLFAITRKLRFTGEGFFSVVKGSRFKVVSPQGAVEVLGTQFNVLSRNNTYKVACLEGKVKVTNLTSTSRVILTTGLSTVLMNKKLKHPKAFKSEITAWRNGEFYFDNSPLNEVLTTLELQYDIRIHFDSLMSRSYTGYFTASNLEEALKLVCLPLDLEYEVLNKKEIKISNKK